MDEHQFVADELTPDVTVLPDRPRHHEAMDTSYLDDEAVIFDERSATVHRLNTSATLVWAMCDGETTATEMAAELAEAFELSIDVFLADVTSAVRRFWDQGMLEGSVLVAEGELDLGSAPPMSVPSGLFVLSDAGEP